MNPRTIVSNILQYSGVNSAAIALRRNSLAVLCYHRVLDVGDPSRAYVEPALITSTHVFERQMEIIARRFHPVTLSEALHWIDGQPDLPPRAVLVTFDDGVADTYTSAFPVMKRYRIPSVVFLATGFVGTGRMHWTDIVHERVATHWGTNAATQEVDRLKQMPSACREDSLMRSGNHDETADSHPNLSWGQVDEMAEQGCEFGSHTRNHLILTHEPDDTIRREMMGAAEDLRSRLGHYPIAFAYPDGQFDDRCMELVRCSGCRAAFTCDEGFVKRGTSRLALPRLLMHDGISSDPSGKFNAAMFLAYLAGTIPKRYKRTTK